VGTGRRLEAALKDAAGCGCFSRRFFKIDFALYLAPDLVPNLALNLALNLAPNLAI
jgi:hypothetical protein